MIRPGNEVLTDRRRAAARWLPTTALMFEPCRDFCNQKMELKCVKDLWSNGVNTLCYISKLENKIGNLYGIKIWFKHIHWLLLIT